MEWKTIDIKLHRLSVENATFSLARFDVVIYMGRSNKLPKQFWYNITYEEVQNLIDKYGLKLHSDLSSLTACRFKLRG